MSSISTLLQQILTAVYGREVRQSIHDAIEQCYSDVGDPTLNEAAFKKAVQAKIDDGSIAALTLGEGSIETKFIKDKAVTLEKIADDVIAKINESAAKIEEFKKYFGIGLLISDKTDYKVFYGATAKIGIKLGYPIGNSTTVYVSTTDNAISVDKASLNFTSENYDTYQYITVTSLTDSDSDSVSEIELVVVIPESGYKNTKSVMINISVPKYTKTNLIADYSGLFNNGANAEHSNSATSWKDLSGNGYDIDLTVNGAVALNDGASYVPIPDPSNRFKWEADRLIYNRTGQFQVIDVTDVPLDTGFTMNFVGCAYQINGYLSAMAVINSANLSDGNMYTSWARLPSHGYTLQGMAGFGGDALRFSLPDIKATELMITYTEDISSNYVIYINGEVYSSGKNGKNFGKPTDYTIRQLGFFYNISGKICHMSVYNKILSPEEVKESFAYFDKLYGLSNVSSIDFTVTPSNSLLPYTSIPISTSVEPLSKKTSTVISYKASSSNVEVE